MLQKKTVSYRHSDLDSPSPVGIEIEDNTPDTAEDYGKKLVDDIEAAGDAEGLDAESSRRIAGAFFRAAAKCLENSAGTPDAEEKVETKTEETY